MRYHSGWAREGHIVDGDDGGRLQRKRGAMYCGAEEDVEVIRGRRTRQLHLFPERSAGTGHEPCHESPGVEAGRRIRRLGQMQHELMVRGSRLRLVAHSWSNPDRYWPTPVCRPHSCRARLCRCASFVLDRRLQYAAHQPGGRRPLELARSRQPFDAHAAANSSSVRIFSIAAARSAGAAGIDERSGAADDLRERAAVSRDDRHARRHRFEHRQAEALVERGQHQQSRAFVERAGGGRHPRSRECRTAPRSGGCSEAGRATPDAAGVALPASDNSGTASARDSAGVRTHRAARRRSCARSIVPMNSMIPGLWRRCRRGGHAGAPGGRSAIFARRQRPAGAPLRPRRIATRRRCDRRGRRACGPARGSRGGRSARDPSGAVEEAQVVNRNQPGRRRGDGSRSGCGECVTSKTLSCQCFGARPSRAGCQRRLSSPDGHLADRRSVSPRSPASSSFRRSRHELEKTVRSSVAGSRDLASALTSSCVYSPTPRPLAQGRAVIDQDAHLFKSFRLSILL